MRELTLSPWYDKALAELRKSMGVVASTYRRRNYVKASTDTKGIFDTSTTHMSYYDNFLNEKDLKYMQEAKNLDGKIVYMTPDEYFEGAAKIFGQKYTTKQLEEQRSDSFTPQYVEDMKNGDRFPLCFLDYANNGQEGLHRMLAAKIAFGPDVKYPVLVVTPYDQELWDLWRLLDDIRNFERYEFKEVIKEAEDELSDWSEPVPDDIAEQMHNKIDEIADRLGYDIEVECQVNDYQGDLRLDVTLTSYQGHVIDSAQPSNASPWLGNMFDMDENKSDEEIDELLDGLDDSDFEIEDFFFK